MLNLGVETSGSPGSVALMREDVCLEERVLQQAGRRHAQTLVIEVQALFAKFSVKSRDCDLVCVSVGPGSFTGLRVGVVFAKTFAYVTGCQLVAVETLHGTAAAAPADVSDLFVIGDAQRDQLFVGRYRRLGTGDWQAAGDITIETADDWCRSRTANDVVTGSGVTKVETELADRCRVLPVDLRSPRAELVARVGQKLFAQGHVDDLWTLEPRYLRKSAAEEKWDATRKGGSGTT